MAEPAVAAQQLTKTFPVPFRRRRVAAVRDVSFRVEAGEIYGLLGPNGSGKSTTLKMLLGLVSPTSGTAEIFGRKSSTVSSREAVGFLPESPYFHKYLTGAETLRFHGKLCGLSGSFLSKRIDDLLDVVGLSAAGNRRLRNYSKGMLQRIGFAQALVHDPRLVVLDEPTAGVDPAGARDMRDLILLLQRRGVTVLISSHLLSEVQQICDRVGILAGGVLVREGSVDELLAVDHRTEIIFEDGSEELARQLEFLIRESGARLIERRKSHTTLERFFLEATEEKNPPRS
ncbi:MAG: ABC transporter ATP-binding protein [Verrucomicrobiota bacterium]|nr:ABC transporter ATP-binding protein [Verrucomicrobiota bacterium]